MTKSKRGRSLFDLLQPEEATGSEASPSSGVGVQQPPAELPRPSGSRTRGTNVARTTPAAAPASGHEPLVEVDGDRFRLSFSSLTAALAVFGLVIVVFAAFWLGGERGYDKGYASGRLSFEAEAVDEIEAARNQPAATHLIEDLLAEAPHQGASPTEQDAVGSSEAQATRWVRDHTYVVAQEFPNGDVEAANRAKDYLATAGILAAVVRRPNGSLQLITAEGYNLKDPAQRELAEELKRRVHSAGAQYYAAGGGYKLEGYFKTLKGDRW